MKRLELEDLYMIVTIKKQEIKKGLQEFLEIVREQEELERCRQKYLEFIFESEPNRFMKNNSKYGTKKNLAVGRL